VPTAEPSPGCLVVIPTYNEASNIEELIRRIRECVPGSRVLVVDDASPDGTGRLVDRVSERDPAVSVLHRAGKLGLGTAYVEGYRHALRTTDADPIVQMDADFSHDPADIPRMLDGLRDHDVVVGSRYVPGGSVVNWGPGRRALSRFGNVYARVATGMRLTDATSGYQCSRRHVIEALPLGRLRSNGYAFQVELKYAALRLGFRVGEIPIRFEDRRVGQSKMNLAIAVEACWKTWTLRFRDWDGP
jgi:dolichol-phosphate mannosyltransferase